MLITTLVWQLQIRFRPCGGGGVVSLCPQTVQMPSWLERKAIVFCPFFKIHFSLCSASFITLLQYQPRVEISTKICVDFRPNHLEHLFTTRWHYSGSFHAVLLLVIFQDVSVSQTAVALVQNKNMLYSFYPISFLINLAL